MIRTLEGRVGSGKTTRVLREVAHCAERQQRALLIVPEQLTLATELQLAAELEAPGFLLAEVLSPTRLMQRVNEAAGGLAGRVVIDERGRAMALRAAMCELEKDLLVYRGCAGRAGFIEWLADLMRECSQGDIGPTELRLAADAVKDEGLRRKLYDLAAIHDRYLDMLKGRFLDTAEAVELFLCNVHRVDFLRDALVWVDGFDIMPPRTLRLMAGLASAAKEVRIALTISPPGERDGELFDPVGQSFTRLSEMAQEMGIPIAREQLPREEYHSGEIGHLEREWDAYPVMPYRGEPEDVELVAAASPRDACEMAAAAMLAFNREQGIPFGEMACAVGDEDAYAPLMRRALEARGIPFFLARPLTAADHPAVRFWLSAMEAATTGMRRDGVSRVLRSGWSGAREDAADRLTNLMVRHGMRGRAWERPIEDDEAMEAARKALTLPLAAYARRVAGKPAAREMATAAYLLLEEAGVYPRLLDEIDACEAGGEGVAAEQHAQVWNRMLEGLDQVVELLGDRILPHAEFLLALEAGLASAQLSALPPMPDQVMVTSVARVKGSGIRALFLLGLNDGVLPATGGAGGLLGGDERAAINGACSERGAQIHFNGALEQDQAEMFSVYAAITLPTDKLYLSYATAGEDGAALRRSVLVDRLQAIFPGLVARSAPRAAKEGGVPALWRAAEALKSGEADEEALATLRYFLAQADARDETAAIRAALVPQGGEEGLEPEIAQRLYGREGLAVTRLERFALCPCRHFIQNGLRPAELYEPSVRPVDAGSLYHAVLDALTGEVLRSGIAWSDLDAKTLDFLLDRSMQPLLEQLLTMPGYEGGFLRTGISELERTLRKTARILAFQLKESRFLPHGRELAFGSGKPYPPLVVPLRGGGAVPLEGRIDRVDLFYGNDDLYLRVIDYKSGDTKLDREAIHTGTSLQLPLYALVAERALGGQTAGLFYCKIADTVVEEGQEDQEGDEIRAAARKHKLSGVLLADTGIAYAMDAELDRGDRIPARLTKDGGFYKNSSALSREELRELLADAEQTSSELAGRILAGEAAPSPAAVGKKIACDTCAYRGICGYP